MGTSRSERWDEIFETDATSVAFRVESLRAFLRDFPDHGSAWWCLGSALRQMSRFAEAEDAQRWALEILPTAGPTYCELGELYRNRGEIRAAEAWYRKAIAERPDHATAFIYQGAMWARLGRLAEAEDSHRRGTLCSSGCVDEAHYNLGLVLRAQGRYAEAAASFAAALRLTPQYKDARLAKRDVERALRLAPHE